MWQGDLHNWSFQDASPCNIRTAREELLKRAAEPAVILARRALHQYDLVPSVYAGQGQVHSRAFFLLLEIVAAFPYLRQCLQQPHVRTVHFDMSPGAFVDAILKIAPTADWHATSVSGEVYEHIRTAKKINGHARLLHDSVAQEVVQAMFVTVQGPNAAQNVPLAISVLHPEGALVIVCNDPTVPEIRDCLAEFTHVHLCKPCTLLPSNSECVLVAYGRQNNINFTPALAAWSQAINILHHLEYTAITECLQLATFLTQIDVKNSADTQKFYLEHLATNSSRLEKAQRLFNFMFKNGIQK